MMNWFTHAIAWDLRERTKDVDVADFNMESQSGGGGTRRGRQQKSSISRRPDLGTAVLEKLQEFGDHDVEWSVQSIAVQQL